MAASHSPASSFRRCLLLLVLCGKRPRNAFLCGVNAISRTFQFLPGRSSVCRTVECPHTPPAMEASARWAYSFIFSPMYLKNETQTSFFFHMNESELYLHNLLHPCPQPFGNSLFSMFCGSVSILLIHLFFRFHI